MKLQKEASVVDALFTVRKPHVGAWFFRVNATCEFEPPQQPNAIPPTLNHLP